MENNIGTGNANGTGTQDVNPNPMPIIVVSNNPNPPIPNPIVVPQPAVEVETTTITTPITPSPNTMLPPPPLVPSTHTQILPPTLIRPPPSTKPPILLSSKPNNKTNRPAKGILIKSKINSKQSKGNGSSTSGPPPLVPRSKSSTSNGKLPQPPKTSHPVIRGDVTPLKIVLLDHNYCLPAPLFSSKEFHSKYSYTVREPKPSRLKPIKFLFKISDEVNNQFVPPHKPPPSRLENLLKRSTALPVYSSISKVKPYYYGSSLYRDEEQDAEVDIESVDPEPEVSYDKDKAHNLMNECEKYVNFARTTDVPENWEDQIVKTGWTKTQRRLFDTVMKAFHSEHFARLSYKGNSSEPVLRRASLDLTAQRVRQALVNVMWNTKLTQWLHGVLIDNLSLGYLGIYLDVLQTLRPKCPTLVDRMVLLSTAAASSLSDPEALRASFMKTKSEVGENAPESEELKKILNAEALNLLLKRQWDPFASVLHEQTKLPSNPIFLIVPNGPSWCHPTNARRYKQFLNMLAGVGKVISVTMNHEISICSVITVHEFAEKMIHFSKLKLAEIKSLFPDRPIFLMGWGSGAIVAATVSLTEKVSGVLCLGFPLLGLSGRRGENSDPLLQMKHPVLFVIGDRAANNTVALMDKFRQDLPVQTNANLLVVRGADGGLKVSRQFRKRLLVTQGYVDKQIVDEITQFVKNVTEAKPPSTPTLLTSNSEMKKQKGRKRVMTDPLFGETGITFNGKEYKFSDESKAIPSNYSCNKRKNYQRTRSVNSESGEEPPSKTITASQLVQGASAVPKKRKPKPLSNVSVQEAVNNIIDLEPSTNLTAPLTIESSTTGYMLNPDVSVVPTSVPLNRNAQLEQTSLPNSVLGTQLALAKPPLLTRNRKSVDKPQPPKMPRLEEEAERIEFKPQIFSGNPLPDTRSSVVPASQIILSTATSTSQLSFDSTSMSNTIVIRTPTPISSPSLVPMNPLAGKQLIHPQMPSLILKNRSSGEPIQIGRIDVTSQAGPGQIISLRPSLTPLRPGVEVASGIIRIPRETYKPYYTYCQQSTSEEPRKIFKVLRTSELKEYVSQGGDLSKVLAPPFPTGEINSTTASASVSQNEGTILNFPGMVGPRFGGRSSVVIVRSKAPPSTPVIITTSSSQVVHSVDSKTLVPFPNQEKLVVLESAKSEKEQKSVTINSLNETQIDVRSVVMTTDKKVESTEEKKSEDIKSLGTLDSAVPTKTSLVPAEAKESVEKNVVELIPEIVPASVVEPVGASDIPELLDRSNSDLNTIIVKKEDKLNTSTEKPPSHTKPQTCKSRKDQTPSPLKSNKTIKSPDRSPSGSTTHSHKRTKPSQNPSPEITRRETRRSNRSESTDSASQKDAQCTNNPKSSGHSEMKEVGENEKTPEKNETVKKDKSVDRKSRDKDKSIEKNDPQGKVELSSKEEKIRITRASLRKNSVSGNTKQ